MAVGPAGAAGDGAGDAAGAEAPSAPHLAMGKRVLFDAAARRAIGRGVAQLARAVRVTLGPRGRTVLVEHAHERPAMTSDGAAVAREIELADPFENLGVRLVREAAERTAREAGDGSSTMTVLADALIAGGLERLAAGPRRSGSSAASSARSSPSSPTSSRRPARWPATTSASPSPPSRPGRRGRGRTRCPGAGSRRSDRRRLRRGRPHRRVPPRRSAPGLAFERGWLLRPTS